MTITMFSDTVSPQIFERSALGVEMSTCLSGGWGVLRSHHLKSTTVEELYGQKVRSLKFLKNLGDLVF